VYFTTDLSQRGSGQPLTNKLFLLRSGTLTLIEQSPVAGGGFSIYTYERVATSESGSVRAINRRAYCQGGSSCLFRELASTTIQTADRQLGFDGNASISNNGRYAALVGNTNAAPGVAVPAGSLRLVDLSLGETRLMGSQPVSQGRFVADDGTVLVSIDGELRSVGPNMTTSIKPVEPMYRAILSPDARRIIHEAFAFPGPPVPFAGTPAGGLRVIELATGVDRHLGSGTLPMLASDGRRFSFLAANASNTPQVWLGDAISGSARVLTNEPEGIQDHAISRDGTKVIAATNTGRLISVDAASGAMSQLLGKPPSQGGLLTLPVPGSYNELRGSFPTDYVPDIRIGTVRAVVLGPSPRGVAIQIPWEAQPGDHVTIQDETAEAAWERVSATVMDASGVALPVGAAGPGGPAYYAIHEDWSGYVTDRDPARPGEIVHMYGTGYGPVDGVVQSGRPTPADRLYRMSSACVWRAIGVLSDPRPIEVLFAGLAPGLFGIYQFDFRVPSDWLYPAFNPYCQFPDSPRFLPTAAIPVAPLRP
jgi:uncharacterized protein (TIGR03437 family)